MKYLFAPLEGITGYPFRRVHFSMFPGVDRYYTPFLAANQTLRFKKKELRDVLPENNAGIPVVPQIMTNRAEHFLNAVRKMQALGYNEVNLNLGCPMAMEVTKKKGAGFLGVPDELDAFFEAVFDGLRQDGNDAVHISVKTRIGLEEASESRRLMEIFNRYPISRLIIHARRRVDFYKGLPDLETFGEMLTASRIPVCYNGDLCTAEDVARFRERFPKVEQVMIGRGLVRDPALVREIRGGERLRIEELGRFERKLFEGYREVIAGDINVMYKMKELWTYFGIWFPEGKKQLKQIRKARTVAAYEEAVEQLMAGTGL